jgi:DNA-directed RNA polymerase beta subunit
MAKVAKVYVNGRLVGFHDDPETLTNKVVESRREGKLQKEINVAYQKDTNEVYINKDLLL